MRKKILFFVALVLLIAVFVTPDMVVAEEAADNYRQSAVYAAVKELCEKFPSRSAGTPNKTPADDSVQAYLSAKLSEATNAEVKYQSFSYDNITYYHNITAELKSKGNPDKQIIIGAHYDGVGQGANDNASGVIALLFVANKLAATSTGLPCNVTFVLFDGEEVELLGSRYYIDNMSDDVKQNTLVMFNLDSIANGDNLYLWCENKRTDMADHILANARGIVEKPYAKGTYNLRSSVGYGYYYEMVQNSDHASFRTAGIPTACFFSGTYDAAAWNYAESVDSKKQVMNTLGDTFEALDENNGAVFVNRIETVIDAVSGSILADGFYGVAQNARKQLVNLGFWYQVWWPTLVVLAAVIGLIVFIILYYRKLQKKAILGTAEVKTNKVFTTPDAEDIFTFKD